MSSVAAAGPSFGSETAFLARGLRGSFAFASGTTVLSDGIAIEKQGHLAI